MYFERTLCTDFGFPWSEKYGLISQVRVGISDLIQLVEYHFKKISEGFIGLMKLYWFSFRNAEHAVSSYKNEGALTINSCWYLNNVAYNRGEVRFVIFKTKERNLLINSHQ